MATPVGRGCPLCLQVEDEASMIAVALPYPKFETHRTVILCRPCAGAITVRLHDIDEDGPPPPAAVKVSHEHDKRAARKPRNKTPREATSPDRSDPDAA